MNHHASLHSCANDSSLAIRMYMSVFVNLFFEAEAFAAILIAHGTHGLSQGFVLGVLL